MGSYAAKKDITANTPRRVADKAPGVTVSATPRVAWEVGSNRPAAGRASGVVWSPTSIVEAQRSAGNVAVIGMLTLQRQQDIPAPPPEVSPEDRQKQIYAATVTLDVSPIDAATKANVEKTLSFAPV
jgi:hypothetical protein